MASAPATPHPSEVNPTLTHERPEAAKLRARIAEIKEGQLYINGESRPAEGGKTRSNIDPSTEIETTRVAEASAKDVQDAIKAAREAFETGPWAKMNAFDRGEILKRVGQLIQKKFDDFAIRESVDVGKPISETRGFDIAWGASSFAFYGGLAGQLDGALRAGQGSSLVYTRREPLGVVGAITPFNFPVVLSVNKIAAALAAGNTFVHKPAEETPLSSLLMAEVLTEAGVPKGVYNVVTGSGEAGAELGVNPGVDKIGFTGSTEVGKKVQEAAAKTLKHVTLELGGKNAWIVFADAVTGPNANLTALVEDIFQAAYFNCGQFCMSCSRLLVQHSAYGTLMDALLARIAKATVGDPFDPKTEVGPLTFKAQYDKVRQYVDIAKQEGASVAVGGNPLRVDATNGKGFFHELTVFTGVKPTMRIAQEEIFGPALSVLTFETEDEALGIANGLPYGLAAGVSTQDIRRAHRVAGRLQAGIVWVNTWNKFTATTPFGGYKQSGYGREIGPEAMHEYLQLKTVYVEMDN